MNATMRLRRSWSLRPGGNGMVEQEFVPPRKYERGVVTVRFLVLRIVRKTFSHYDVELE